MTWHAVGSDGLDLATGRLPQAPGATSPAAALAAAPVATWPLATLADDGRRVDVAAALGPGGTRVVALLDRIVTGAPPPGDLDLAALAGATPGGFIAGPLAVVGLAGAAEAAGQVDPTWLAVVDERRSAPRVPLTGAARGTELEAALHLAMLLATSPLDEGCPPEARVASGARLWLLGGAVAWALLGAGDRKVGGEVFGDSDDPFRPWGDLVSYGIWPVGPVANRLVVGMEATTALGAGGAPLTTARV